MTDNMKKLLEAVSKDEALKAELKVLADGKPDDAEAVKVAAIELAAKHGFTLTDDDFKPSEMTELTEDEMKSVAGGATCSCSPEGSGKGTFLDCDCFGIGDGKGVGGCACVYGGWGGGW